MTGAAFTGKALTYTDSYGMLDGVSDIIVGLSGGADSTALLALLASVREERGLTLFAVHVNHMLRGDEAEEDEAFCRRLCEAMNIGFHCESVDVRALSERECISIEEAGRAARYEAFEAARKSRGADKIAVAHNKNDNAETVLHRLIRGTGSKGLCGIPPVRGDIIRPLLCVTRAEIEAYLSARGIAFRTDSTNAGNDYTRNKIRNILLPLIEREFNPSAVDAISRLAELLSGQEAFLQRITEAAYEGAADGDALKLEELSGMDVYLQKLIIRRAVSGRLGGLKDLSFAHIEAAYGLLNSQTGANVSLPHGLVVSKCYDRLLFESGVGPEPYRQPLPFEEKIYVPALGRRIKLSCRAEENTDDLLYTKAFYCDKISETFELRTRLPGDRFSKKLSDYMIDIKLPRRERSEALLVCAGSEVLVFFSGGEIYENKKRLRVCGGAAIYINIYRG